MVSEIEQKVFSVWRKSHAVRHQAQSADTVVFLSQLSIEREQIIFHRVEREDIIDAVFELRLFSVEAELKDSVTVSLFKGNRAEGGIVNVVSISGSIEHPRKSSENRFS